MNRKLFVLALIICLTVAFGAAAAETGEYFFKNNISGDTRLVDMHMLGAHDAFTAGLNSNSPVDAAGVKLNDSGSKGAQSSWGTNVINASKAQSANIEELLNSGVRYFDVRLSRYQNGGEFYTTHGRISDQFTGEGGIARKIAAWAEAHPGEIVVLDFQSLFDIQTSSGGAERSSWRDLYNKLNADGIIRYVYTGDGSVDRHTYDSLTNGGTRAAIVIFTQVTGAWEVPDHFINRRDNDTASDGYMRSFHTEKESYTDLRAALAQEYDDLLVTNREKYYYRFRVMQAQTTPGLLSILFGRANLINDANTNNIKILTDDSYDKWSKILPVLMVDNATSDSGDFNALAVEKLARMNREYTAGIYRADSGNVTLMGSNEKVPLNAEFNATLDGESLTLSLSDGENITGEMTVIIRANGKKQQLCNEDGDLLGETADNGLLSAKIDSLGTFTLIETEDEVGPAATLPLLWYNFMEGSADVSGSGLDASPVGEPAIGGGTATVSSGNVLKLPEGLTKHMGSYTASAWIKLNANVNGSRLFDIGRQQRSSVFAQAGSDKTSSALKNQNTVTAEGAGLKTGEWTHMAVSYENGTLSLYLNGQKVRTNTTNDPAPNTINDYFNPYGSFIGRTTWFTFNEYPENNPDINADIADFRIYSGALSAGEISRLGSMPCIRFVDVLTGEEFRSAQEMTVPQAYTGDYIIPEELDGYTLVSAEGGISDMAGRSSITAYYRYDESFILSQENGEATASAKMRKNRENLRLILAAYTDGEDGAPMLVQLISGSVSGEKTLTLSLAEGEYAKAFLWDEGVLMPIEPIAADPTDDPADDPSDDPADDPVDNSIE